MLSALAATVHLAYASPAFNTGLQFTAATIADVQVFFRAQPNCNGAVGPTQYIEMTNQNLRSFSKECGKPDGILDIDSGTFLGAQNADAMLTFDRWGQRWLMTGIIGSSTNQVYPFTGVAIAWSDGPIITKYTQWTVYHFASETIAPPTGSLVDSPKLASDQNAVYINVDTFTEAATLGVTSIIIPQSSFLPGHTFDFTAFPYLFNPTQYPVQGGLGFAPSPDNYDCNPEFGYIVVSPISAGTLANNFLMLRILNPGSASPSLYPSAANPISLPASNYASAPQVPHKGNLYGANGLLENFTNLDAGVHIRNHQLYVSIIGLVDATGAASLAGDRTAILWYQYDLTGDPSGCGNGNETESTIPVLIQSGIIYDPTITDTPRFFWNQALVTNKNNNMMVIGNFSGENDYIQAFYTSRKATDPLGTLNPITLLTNNTSSYNFGTLLPTNANYLRWGDYCSIKPDPINDRDLWATSQIVAFQDGWGILATQFKPTKCMSH